jgi:hypothetical protein
MAARKRRTELNDKWREKIAASMLVNRLAEHALSAEEVMTQSQVRAAEILLKKVAPDLKAVEHSGPDGERLNFNISVTPHGEDNGNQS